MSNLIYVMVDGRDATDKEIDALVINSYPGRSQFDIDFVYPNGKLVDGHTAGFRFQTEIERELLEALILLEAEMVLSGNAGSTDYGWKPAIEKTRAAIAKATGSQS